MASSSTGPSFAAAPGSKPAGKGDNFRRTWDIDEYEKKAKERIQEEIEEELAEASNEKPVKRELLQARDFEVDLEGKLGKSIVITKTTPLSDQGGYFCNVCDCVVKDSINFLDHINGKKHQRNLGMSMKVERSTLDQVKRRFEMNKQKREEEKKRKEYDFEARIKELQEEEEKAKHRKKEAKKERKRKAENEINDYVDPDVAAMMGFGGFGSSKKK